MAVNKAGARKLLRSEESCAYTCMRAADLLLGDQWFNWEPETIWLTLQRDGVKMPEGNRAQLLAGRGLIIHGRYWYDAVVYEKTCLALNNEEPLLNSMTGAPVTYMAWSAYEAKLIDTHYDPDTPLRYDRECIEYAALQLKEEGYVVAPSELEWAQERLDHHNPSELSSLRAKIRKAWAASPKGESLRKEKIPETTLGVQVARLGAAHSYVQERKNQLHLDLASLKI